MSRARLASVPVVLALLSGSALAQVPSSPASHGLFDNGAYPPDAGGIVNLGQMNSALSNYALKIATYTVATLPSPCTPGAQGEVYVSDGQKMWSASAGGTTSKSSPVYNETGAGSPSGTYAVCAYATSGGAAAWYPVVMNSTVVGN